MAIYYVRKSGNNANDGLTPATAKLTLNGAEDIPVVAGDTVFVGAGTYREQLTCDVSGSDGNPITYIGDYTGQFTGDPGIIRVTGSDNDLTPARNYSIYANNKSYRIINGLSFDLTNDYAIYTLTNHTNWIIRNCHFQLCSGIIFNTPGANHLVENCYFLSGAAKNGIYFYHGTGLSNRNVVIQNCILMVSTLNSDKVGGILVKNSLFMGASRTMYINTLPAGQNVTVNNSVFVGATWRTLEATALGELVEDYNTFYLTATPRTNVAVGANSVTTPPIFDARWFFEAVKNE